MSDRLRRVLGWTGVAVCAAFIAIGTVITVVYDPVSFDWSGLFLAAALLVAPTFGALVLSRAPNRVGWLLLLVGFGGTLAIVLGSLADAGVAFPGRVWAAWVANWVWPLSLGSVVLILQLFPDGTPLTRRWRWLAWLTLVAIGSLAVGGAFGPGQLGDYEHVTNPVGIEALRDSPISAEFNIGWLLIIPSVVGSAASLVVRYRRSRGERRQQLKWLTYAASLFGLGWIALVITYEAAGLEVIGGVVFAFGVLSIPVAVGIAILKFRLYDIDVVINKTLVYGSLAVFISAVYVGLVVGVGSALDAGLWLSIAATALVAVAFEPVRARMQRLANRLVYGERATPYEVMAAFSERMAATVSVDEVLPRTAEAAARGVGAEAARVTVRLAEEARSATWPEGGTAGAFDRAFPVEDRGEVVGEIAVRTPPGEPLAASEEALLLDLAAQAGLGLRNVRLTAELERRVRETDRLAREIEASRRRILIARDEERRRLERRVHDGPQRRLAAMHDRLGAVEAALSDDRIEAVALLDALGAEAAQTLDLLRDLARGIFPPLLADQGLAAALEAQSRKLGRPIELAPDLAKTRFEPEAEASAYFCGVLLLEEAADGAVAVTREGDAVVLTSPGRGIGDVTLQRIRDRAEAVGGGVARNGGDVVVRIPAPAQPEVAAAQASSSRSGSNSDLGM